MPHCAKDSHYWPDDRFYGDDFIVASRIGLGIIKSVTEENYVYEPSVRISQSTEATGDRVR